MGFSSTIQATLGLGIGKFTDGLRRAGDQAGEFNKELKKKFSAGDLSRGLIASLALDAKSIAETIAGAIMGGTQEGWERAKDAVDSFNTYLEERFKKTLGGERLAEYLRRASADAQREATTPRRQLGEGEGSNWFVRQSGGALRSLANRLGMSGAETEAEALARQITARERALRLADEAAEVEKKAAEEEEKSVLTEAALIIKQEDASSRAQAEAKKAEQEITAEKQRQAAVEAKAGADRLRDLALAAAAQREATRAVADALSDQSAATLGEITGGTRGSRADRARAAEVERLRARARTARDTGRVSLIGGEAVSVADQLSTRANQIQSGIQSLNTAERDPLASVTQRLDQANAELAAIKASLEIMELEN